MSSMRELTKRKDALTYQIKNIKADYAGVDKEDFPEVVTVEIARLMEELIDIRAQLGK